MICNMTVTLAVCVTVIVTLTVTVNVCVTLTLTVCVNVTVILTLTVTVTGFITMNMLILFVHLYHHVLSFFLIPSDRSNIFWNIIFISQWKVGYQESYSQVPRQATDIHLKILRKSVLQNL